MLDRLVGMAAALEPLAEHEVDGEALLGRLGVGALALERRQVRGADRRSSRATRSSPSRAGA